MNRLFRFREFSRLQSLNSRVYAGTNRFLPFRTLKVLSHLNNMQSGPFFNLLRNQTYSMWSITATYCRLLNFALM